MRSSFLVGSCPDPKVGAKPDDTRFDHFFFPILSSKMENGMYPEGAQLVISCPKFKTIWSDCRDGAWDPPLDCTGTNKIYYFKIEKHTEIVS